MGRNQAVGQFAFGADGDVLGQHGITMLKDRAAAKSSGITTLV